MKYGPAWLELVEWVQTMTIDELPIDNLDIIEKIDELEEKHE